VPREYPKQQEKTQVIVNALKALLRSKSEQEKIAAGLPGKLAAAIEKSNRIMSEDIIREAGYMLPQSENTIMFLKSLLNQKHSEGFPIETVKNLFIFLITKWRIQWKKTKHLKTLWLHSPESQRQIENT
jgi:hypothetical protein